MRNPFDDFAVARGLAVVGLPLSVCVDLLFMDLLSIDLPFVDVDSLPGDSLERRRLKYPAF